MVAVLLPNQYTPGYGLNFKIFNWAPVMMALAGFSALSYWFSFGKYNINV